MDCARAGGGTGLPLFFYPLGQEIEGSSVPPHYVFTTGVETWGGQDPTQWGLKSWNDVGSVSPHFFESLSWGWLDGSWLPASSSIRPYWGCSGKHIVLGLKQTSLVLDLKQTSLAAK